MRGEALRRKGYLQGLDIGNQGIVLPAKCRVHEELPPAALGPMRLGQMVTSSPRPSSPATSMPSVSLTARATSLDKRLETAGVVADIVGKER